MKVAVIGAGTTGRATGVGLQRKGSLVSFFDTDPKIAARLKTAGLDAAGSAQECIRDAQVVFLCLPTPVLDGGYDLSCIEESAQDISDVLKDQVVALRSTVLPGTTRKISRWIPADKLAYNPEFLREAFALEDFLNPPRIVVGAKSENARKMLEEVYKPFKTSIIATDWETAEMAKLVSNAFLATKISFFNEVWLLCNRLGLDVESVERVASLDKRIGPFGTKGGSPFEGSCLPKDVNALYRFGRNVGEQSAMLEATLKVNGRMSDGSVPQRDSETSLDAQMTTVSAQEN